MITIRQVHGTVVEVVRAGGRVVETEDGRAVLEGDGMLTGTPGLMLGIQVADCVPVLIADVERRVVGAFHAGWRGTVGGIVGEGVRRMREEFGSRPAEMVAAIGPSIGPCCYSVGEEVRSGFERAYTYGTELFEVGPGGAPQLDLWEANRRQLIDAGVGRQRVAVLRECTSCSRDADGERRYFSHRAEEGRAGRMMGLIGVLRESGVT